MFGLGRKKSFADELRETAARAPQKKRVEEQEQKRVRINQAIASWYQECHEEARSEADKGHHEARVGTGYSPKNRPPEDQEVLSAVLKRLRQTDKLKARLQVVKSNWTSDDTGHEITKETLVIVMNW